MPTLTDLNALVEKFAAAIPNLNLDGDEQNPTRYYLFHLITS